MTKKTATEQHEQVRMIALTQLRSSTYNPRRTFNESKLDELADSIRAVGLIQPIVARPIEDDAYQIVAGERRYQAAQRAGLTEVLVHIKPLTEAQAREITLVENAQREDVHPYEEAAALKSLLELPGYDVPALASKIGRSASHVYARLQLANLTPDIVTPSFGMRLPLLTRY